MALQRVAIPSPNHGGTRPSNQLLVVHTSEGATTFRSLGNFLANPRAKVSYHVGFDDTTADQIGEYVQPMLKSWSAHQANSRGEHGCCCTPSGASRGWSRAQWLSRPRMLAACQKWLAEEGARLGIPVRKIGPAEIRAGAKGVCGHADCVQAGLGGTHVDPGPNFPWDVVCRTGPSPAPEPPPTPEPEPGLEVHDMFWIGTDPAAEGDKKAHYHLFGAGQNDIGFHREINSEQALRLASMGYPHQDKQNPLVVISMLQMVGLWRDPPKTSAKR